MKKQIFLFCFLFLAALGYAQKTTVPEANWALVDQYLQSGKDLSGIVLLAHGGEVKLSKSYGFANREKQIPYSEKTLATIGSVTKPFTATAIMLLLEQGKLRVEDPISKYFSNVPDDKKGITLHQLLTHSAGLPGALGDDYVAISKEEFLQLVWKTPLSFVPGTSYDYSNVGYSLLGMIVEQVSGKSYDAFLQQNIFAPAGMKTAGYTNPAADYSLLTHGYRKDGGDWGDSKSKLWNGNEPYWHLKANGGVLMSAEDLVQWYRALRSNKILKPKTLKLQTTPYVDEGSGDSFYSYGYVIFNDGESVEHNGGNGIFRTDFRWFPQLDVCLIAFSNDANTRLFRFTDEVVHIMRTGQLPQVIEPINWQPIVMAQFPATPRQQTAKALLDVLAGFSPEKATAFMDKHCSPGIIDRNGKSRLTEILQMLSKDSGGQPVSAIFESGEKLQLVLPAGQSLSKLKITLTFLNDQVDKLQAEMEGR